MEVMGLMLGDFVDDYTVRVVDVNSPFPFSPAILLRIDHNIGICYASKWYGSLS